MTAGHETAPAGGVAGAVARSDSGGDEPDPIRDTIAGRGRGVAGAIPWHLAEQT
jgi:hypothetical protein